MLNRTVSNTFFTAAALVLLCLGTATAQEADLLPPREDPVVEAIVATPRRTPADFARAVFTLTDLGEGERAAPILKQLIDQQPDDATLVALVREFGTAKFLKLSRDPALGPDAAAFVDQLLAAAAASDRDPQRLAALIERLGSDNRAERTAALVDFRTTGLAGAEYLMAELPKATAKKQNNLRKALVGLAPISTPLLLGALDATVESDQDVALVTQATIALGELREDQAAPFMAVLATLAPEESTASQAAIWGYQQITGRRFSFEQFVPVTSRGIERYLEAGPAFSPDATGGVPVAAWDQNKKQVVTARLPAEEAGVVLAARLAEAQAAVQGDRPDLVRRALVLVLEARAIRERRGLPMDADNPVAGASPDQLSDALLSAVRDGRSGAAVGLCRALAELGDVNTLATATGLASPLASALDAAHPAVRYAALQAILELKPQTPFPGSSRVAPTLEYFATGEGEPYAVVAMPNLQRSATFGGQLNGSGVRPRITNRGCEAVELAEGDPDLTAVFVDMAILDPHVRETLFRLRRQTASAGVPIALTAGDGRLLEAEKIAKEHTRVLAVPRLHTSEDASAVLGELAALLPPDWPDADTRLAQTKQAREWLADLAANGPAFYRVKSPAASQGSGAREPGSGTREAETLPVPPETPTL